MEQKTQKSPQLRITPEVAAATIADRCRTDDAFARKLRDDPGSALAELGGQQVPENMNVAVHQNAPDHWHIVIPSQKQAERLSKVYKMMDDAGGSTLNDEQLEAVSGGEILVTILTFTAILVPTAVAATAAVGGVVAGAIVGASES